jgi:hypothetical protein
MAEQSNKAQDPAAQVQQEVARMVKTVRRDMELDLLDHAGLVVLGWLSGGYAFVALVTDHPRAAGGSAVFSGLSFLAKKLGARSRGEPPGS